MSTSAMRQLLLLFMLIIYTSQLCEDKEEVFKPSDEWQEVKECQSIPPGLHVRINLQTGLKEAKLLTEADSDSNNKNGAIQVSDVVSEDKLFDQENIRKLSKDDLTMMLSKLKDESHPSEMTSQDSFNRSNELINEQFYTDTEIMYSLLELLVDTNITDEDVIFYLLELEFYVHQFDNAHNLHSLGGLSLVIRFLNHSNHLVRSTAALTIGSALQSNPKIQKLSLSFGVLPILLFHSSLSQPEIVQRRMIFALSALLRGQSKITNIFVQLKGIEELSMGFDKRMERVKTKIVFLLTDLISTLKQDKDSFNSTTKILLDNNWCDYSIKLLTSSNVKTIEGTVLLINSLIETCDYSGHATSLHSFFEDWINSEHYDDSLSDVISNIKTILRHMSRKTEL